MKYEKPTIEIINIEVEDAVLTISGESGTSGMDGSTYDIETGSFINL